MKIIKTLGISLVIFLLMIGIIFVALGLLLPNEFVVNNQIEIEATREDVWAVIDEREKFKEWVPNIERVEVIDEKRWKEFPKNSDIAIEFEVVNVDKPTKYELRYQMENKMAGEWRGDFEKIERGTLLKTEDKLIHKSWFGKILMPLFFDLDSFAKDFNQRLKERAESTN